MMRLGKKIRLTPLEHLRWLKVTGFPVHHVMTLTELDAYIERCKRYYDGHGPETKLLHFLIDRERMRCFDGPDGLEDRFGG